MKTLAIISNNNISSTNEEMRYSFITDRLLQDPSQPLLQQHVIVVLY